MAKERKNADCINARITLCGEAMRIIHKRQAEAKEKGVTISINTAIEKLILEK